MKASTSDRFQEYMAINELTQAELLRKCSPYFERRGIKIYKSILNQYVSGYRTPGKDKLLIFAEAMNVSVYWLAGDDVPMERTNDVLFSPESAIILAEAAKDKDLISCIGKIQDLSEPGKQKVYGYVDALHDAEC